MAQMNLCANHKQTHRHKEQTRGCQGGGRWEGLGVWDQQMEAIRYRMDKQQAYGIAQGTIFSIL